MSDPDTIFGGLAMAHIWQSVGVAAVLAVALILGRKLNGSTRYWLSGAAFAACLILPLASFIPGESLLRSALKATNAPVSMKTAEQVAEEKAALAEATAEPAWKKIARENGAPNWTLDLGTRLAKTDAEQKAANPGKPTALEQAATDAGVPAWSVPLARSLFAVSAEPAAKPETRAAFALPEIKLPNWNLPALTLPILLVWIAGALLMLVRTGRDLIAVERLVARAKPIELPADLKRRMPHVRVAVSAEAPGPMAAGLFRPTVVLPEATPKLDNAGMAALLEHERAHIERRDMVVALLQRIVLALLWWSPALHWISRRIDEERELACDETAVARTGDARAFARSLTTQAENQLWARAPRLAVGAIGPRSQFGRRVKRLIEIAKSGGAPTRYSGRIAFSVLAVTVVVAALATPRILAEPKAPPVDSALAGAPNEKRGLDLAQLDADRKGRVDARFDDIDDQDIDQDLALLGESLQDLFAQIGEEVELSLAGSQPALAGLSAELAGLGAEIALAVNAELADELPQILQEVQDAVRESRERGWSDEERAEFRRDMEEMRRELRDQFGPEFREEISSAVEEARKEVEAHRDEWRKAALDGQEAGKIAREAMAEARKEIAEARARGDFDNFRNFEQFKNFKRFRDLDVDIRFDRDVDVDNDRDRGERLLRAARRGDAARVRELIKSGYDVNTVVGGDGTALIEAARAGQIDVMRILLDAGANPNLNSPGDGNPLIGAAARGHDDAVRLLLDRGAKVNAPAPGDGNALIAAAQRGQLDIVRLLLDRGANVNAYVAGDETPLMAAAEHGGLDIVKLLVARGANVNLAYNVEISRWQVDRDVASGGRLSVDRTELRSPLNMAQKHGHDDVADFLKSKGAVASPKPAN